MKSEFDQIKFTSTTELIEDGRIYKLPAVSLILAALLDNSFLSSEHSKARLTNEHVVKMAGSPLSEGVVPIEKREVVEHDGFVFADVQLKK